MKIKIKNLNDTLKVNAVLLDIQKDIANGKVFEVEIKEFKEKRSLDANAYFHLLVDKLAKKLNISATECKRNLVLDYGTIDTDNKGLKIGFKLLASIDPLKVTEYPKIIGQCEENGLLFNKIIVYKQTRFYDTKEMSLLINGVVEECKNLGIETATPEEINKMLSLLKTVKN